MKVAVTGAAGFTGSVLTEILRDNNIEVYAFVRNGSAHNIRLNSQDPGIHCVEADLGNLEKVAVDRGIKCDRLFHLAWAGGSGLSEQKKNVEYTLDALKAAAVMNCKRFVATGSQAEYGVIPATEMQKEERVPAPFTPYGAAKVAACYLSRELSKELGIEWIWGRIFSLIGKNEPAGRMLPDLYNALKENRRFSLSSCRQNWDYLDVYDAADALVALADRGRAGEIYNIANGDYKPLIEYTEMLKDLVNPNGIITYGGDPNPFVSLQPMVDKIRHDTGWQAKRSFEESIKAYKNNGMD